MPAQDHLSTGLFHGTTVPLKVGDIVKPASQTGHTPYRGLYGESKMAEGHHSRGDHVFMTTDEGKAWGWAESGRDDVNPENNERENLRHPVPYMERSTRVYEVEPIGGAHHPDDVGVPGGELIWGEKVTKKGQGARVVREHVIPPPDEVGGQTDPRGRQGELPGVNWKAHSTHSAGYEIGYTRLDNLRGLSKQAKANLAGEFEANTPLPSRGPRLDYPHKDEKLPGI